MIDQIPPLVQLLKQLQQVPYLASKNLYRVAHHLLEMDDARFAQFLETLKLAHRSLDKCTDCWAWKERDVQCLLCTSPKRDQDLLCVVHTWHDLCALERTGGFTGVYHVLGGSLCPLDGIGPEDLTIEALVARVKKKAPREIIFALNQTPEGEATAAFIARNLAVPAPSITCLARGLPVGSTLEYMDRLTLHKALAERRPF